MDNLFPIISHLNLPLIIYFSFHHFILYAIKYEKWKIKLILQRTYVCLSWTMHKISSISQRLPLQQKDVWTLSRHTVLYSLLGQYCNLFPSWFAFHGTSVHSMFPFLLPQGAALLHSVSRYKNSREVLTAAARDAVRCDSQAECITRRECNNCKHLEDDDIKRTVLKSRAFLKFTTGSSEENRFSHVTVKLGVTVTELT
jgi:hypothetical protein